MYTKKAVHYDQEIPWLECAACKAKVPIIDDVWNECPDCGESYDGRGWIVAPPQRMPERIMEQTS